MWKIYTVRDGISKIQAPTVKLNPQLLTNILQGVNLQDDGMIDSIAADCIIQDVLFGEIVYGIGADGRNRHVLTVNAADRSIARSLKGPSAQRNRRKPRNDSSDRTRTSH